MTATYTFFESATHKGWLLQVFGTVLPSHWEREAWGDIQGTAIGLRARPQHTETWLLDFETIGRTNRESEQTFRARAEAEALAAWAVVKREREEFAAKIAADGQAEKARLEAQRKDDEQAARSRLTTETGEPASQVALRSPRKTAVKAVPVKAA